jgi:hypothetical protein
MTDYQCVSDNAEPNMNVLKFEGALATTLLIASPVFAHHSAAGVDQTTTVTVEGVVKQFKWANPHSWVEIEVTNSKGVAEIWNFEMGPPSTLIKSGWKANTVKPGEKVTVTARPMKNGDPGGIYVAIALASGKTLGQVPTAAPAKETY